MTEHTPGPWEVIPTPSGTFGKDWRIIWAPSTRRPVVVHGEYITTKYGEPETVAGVQISEANANLIAAAPALLAAAEASLNEGFFTDGAIKEQLRAAISQARGEE